VSEWSSVSESKRLGPEPRRPLASTHPLQTHRRCFEGVESYSGTESKWRGRTTYPLPWEFDALVDTRLPMQTTQNERTKSGTAAAR